MGEAGRESQIVCPEPFGISSSLPGVQSVGVSFHLLFPFSLAGLIKAKSELECSAADGRAGRPAISRGRCNGVGIALASIQELCEGIFLLATAEPPRGVGRGGWGGRKRVAERGCF